MQSNKDKLDVLGTFLRNTKIGSPSERVVWACARLGRRARISQVFDILGMSEDDFAQAVGEAESRRLIFRERDNDQVYLVLTLSGQQLWEQSLPQ